MNKKSGIDDIKVAIIGGLHHNTLGVIRSLGEQGILAENIDVLLVDSGISERNIITQSRYVEFRKVVHVDTTDGIIPWLLKVAADNCIRTIICCSDAAAASVIGNASRLKKFYYIPTTEIDISKLMSKSIQSKLAAECGLNIPDGIEINTKGAWDWSVFPCITKPLESIIGRGKADIHISQNKNELVQAIAATKAERVQIQQYLTKKMEYQLIGCSLDAGKQIIIPGFTRIIRQPENTNTGYLEYAPIERLSYDKGAVERFIKKIGYSGLFSVEFIRDQDDTDYFLEINMRNDGNAYCVTSAGVNLPYIWCYYQQYHQFPDVLSRISKNVMFIPDFLDMRRGIKEVGVFGWLEQFVSAQSHSLFNVKDMKPFMFTLRKWIWAHLKSICK